MATRFDNARQDAGAEHSMARIQGLRNDRPDRLPELEGGSSYCAGSGSIRKATISRCAAAVASDDGFLDLCSRQTFGVHVSRVQCYVFTNRAPRAVLVLEAKKVVLVSVFR